MLLAFLESLCYDYTVIQGGNMTRRQLLTAVLGSPLFAQTLPPNVVVILADDLGYGDLGCYGSHTLTPHIDSLAREGIKFTDYHSGSSVCTPSRAALLTGLYPQRTGLVFVLDPLTDGGFVNQQTIAHHLASVGYATGCFGKWHVGHLDNGYLPTHQGFEEFFGIPYSHDMRPLPLMLGTQKIADATECLPDLDKLFTQVATNFIRVNKNRPFCAYVALTTPHTPLPYTGKRAYEQTVTDLDACVGEILQTLKEQGLEENTLVIFTSDNGPALGNTGGLKGGKESIEEGGHRVPFLSRLPGQIPANTCCRGLASGLDLLPTLVRLCGTGLKPRPIDGVDIWPLLSGQAQEVARRVLLHPLGNHIGAIRTEWWKLLLNKEGSPTALYEMGGTLEYLERINRLPESPDIADILLRLAAEVTDTFP